MATLSTSTVERLVDLILDVKRELKQDIADVRVDLNRVETKVDEALKILEETRARDGWSPTDYKLKQLEIAVAMAERSLATDPPMRDIEAPATPYLDVLQPRIQQCLRIVEQAIPLD